MSDQNSGRAECGSKREPDGNERPEFATGKASHKYWTRFLVNPTHFSFTLLLSPSRILASLMWEEIKLNETVVRSISQTEALELAAGASMAEYELCQHLGDVDGLYSYRNPLTLKVNGASPEYPQKTILCYRCTKKKEMR